MQIILDISANTHKNNIKYLKNMIDSIPRTDKHEIIIKHQLFEVAGQNLPLRHEVFTWAYEYARKKGFKTTSSVFDTASLEFLFQFKIPFVKIANRRDLYWLIEKVPRTIPVYVSADCPYYLPLSLGKQDKILFCISKYPSCYLEYHDALKKSTFQGISDHTEGIYLIKTHKTEVKTWEKHFKLSDSSGMDAGSFAITPQELKEIL